MTEVYQPYGGNPLPPSYHAFGILQDLTDVSLARDSKSPGRTQSYAAGTSRSNRPLCRIERISVAAITARHVSRDLETQVFRVPGSRKSVAAWSDVV